MIIVEGGDNVGKSTLVRQLVETDNRLRVLHRDRYKPQREETIATSYLKALLPADGDRARHGIGIADRLVASECIYGKLFRDGCRMTAAEHWTIRNVLHSYNAVVVWCDPPDDAIRASWRERDQLYDDPTTIARAYREELPKIFASLPVMRYDYTATDAAAMRSEITLAHEASLRPDELTWWGALPYGVGQLRHARLVLVGEQSTNGPVPFTRGPAAEFLAWTLAQAREHLAPEQRPWLDRLYVTNAIKHTERDGAILREELRSVVAPDDRALIVALGREAERACESIGASLGRWAYYAAMPHPQYWGRFQYPKRLRYATQLVALLKEVWT